MKKLALILSLFLTACATNDYQVYAENTAKLVQASNAAEAACLLVMAEGLKSGDNSTKTMITTQIDKCRKEIPKIDPPKRSWHGLW